MTRNGRTRRKPMRITPHSAKTRERFCLLAGIVCLLFSALPARQTVWFLFSAAAHELGHVAVMRLLGIPIRGIFARAGGAVLRWESASVPYWQECFCAAAGPAVNVLLALVLYRVDAVGCAVNVLLAVYNLLPLRGNDGAVMLSSLFSLCGNGDGMQRVLDGIGDAVLAVLLMLGAWLFWYGALQDTDGVTLGYGALFVCLFARMIGEAGEEHGRDG